MKLYVLIMKHLDEEHIAIVNSKLGTDKEGEGLELWELFKKKYAGSEAHHQMLALGEFIDLWIRCQRTSIGVINPEEITVQVKKGRQGCHGRSAATTGKEDRKVLQLRYCRTFGKRMPQALDEL